LLVLSYSRKEWDDKTGWDYKKDFVH